jgi:hypothetical protein
MFDAFDNADCVPFALVNVAPPLQSHPVAVYPGNEHVPYPDDNEYVELYVALPLLGPDPLKVDVAPDGLDPQPYVIEYVVYVFTEHKLLTVFAVGLLLQVVVFQLDT